MARIRGNPSEKWARRAAQSTEDYATGVQNPRTDWAQSTVAAAPIHAQAMAAAATRGSFAKGVQAAGSGKWQAKSLSKGTQRFGPGVADAQGDYQKGVQPYLDVLTNMTLPPRGPKGSPQNLQRVAAVMTALRTKKTGGA